MKFQYLWKVKYSTTSNTSEAYISSKNKDLTSLQKSLDILTEELHLCNLQVTNVELINTFWDGGIN